MTIGLNSNVTKTSLDSDTGNACAALRKAFAQIEELHHYFLITPDATLTSLGYTASEVAIIKSAFSDGDQLYNIAIGNATLVSAVNLMANIDQMIGDGLVTR